MTQYIYVAMHEWTFMYGTPTCFTKGAEVDCTFYDEAGAAKYFERKDCKQRRKGQFVAYYDNRGHRIDKPVPGCDIMRRWVEKKPLLTF